MQTLLKKTEWDRGVCKQVEKGNEQGIDLRPYAELGYNCNVIKQIRRAKAVGIDLDYYVREGCDGEQLREIRVGIQQGISLDEYLKAGFCGAQLRQIRKGIRHFVDVKAFADICYNWLQMKEIRLGLQHRVDISVYANSFYSYTQMREIRLGLEEGIDVSSYARLIYSCADMIWKRKKLTEQLYAKDKELKGVVVIDEVTGLKIRLSENRLEAYTTLPKEHRKMHVTVDYVKQILKKNGIVFGIDRAAIEQAMEEQIFDEEILVARGKEPGRGVDGRYEYKFDINPSRKPVEMDDGRVDYQNVEIFEEVDEGQIIAKYIPASRGKMGKSVQGIRIPGIMGKELPVLQGNGFLLKDDGVTYVAAISGMIEYKNDEIQIYEVLVIKEDVGASYGNIFFHGAVHIFGNVGANVEICAMGSVSIEGYVEAASIQSGRDVLIKNGMSGAGKGVIHAKGNIIGNFFEACDLHAGGNVEAGYLMNAHTIAENRVTIMGRKGSIIGGKTKGIYGIEAYNIGNRFQILTEVETGVDQEILEKISECQTEYEKVQSELLKIANKIRLLTDEEKKTPVYKKILLAQLSLKEQEEEMRKRRAELQKIRMTVGNITVMKRAYTGTKIIISQLQKTLDVDYKMTTFYLENKEIVNK